MGHSAHIMEDMVDLTVPVIANKLMGRARQVDDLPKREATKPFKLPYKRAELKAIVIQGAIDILNDPNACAREKAAALNALKPYSAPNKFAKRRPRKTVSNLTQSPTPNARIDAIIDATQ